MGILERIRALFSGMVHGTAHKLESNNPEWLIADGEERIRKTRKKAMEQLIEIQTWTEMIRLDMKEAEDDLVEIQDQISLATVKGDRDLLAGLILKQDDYQEYYRSKKYLFDSAVEEAKRIRDNYHRFEGEMNEKTRLLKNIKSQAKLAEIRGHILDLEETYNSNSQLSENIDNLRFIINQQSARVMAAEQVERDRLSSRVKELEYNVKWNNALERASALLEAERKD